MHHLTIGVLALQGAFAKHANLLRKLGANVIEVRKPADLASCHALVIPGGESTTMLKQMAFIGLFDALVHFATSKPIFGTCAGLILMSHQIIDSHMQPLNLLDIVVERNAFGRQVESFHTEIDVHTEKWPDQFEKKKKQNTLPALFIRAPRIRSVGSNVTILASYEGEAVLVQQGHHLGATFHPELTPDSTIHTYFLKLCQELNFSHSKK